MIKKILNLCVLFSVLTSTAHASFSAPYPNNWKHIRTLSDYTVYHKVNYTNIVDVRGEKRLNTWAKYVARDNKPNMFYMKKDDYVLVQLQIICNTRQYAILSGTTYFSEGRTPPRASQVDDPQFNIIKPHSIEARIANKICGNSQRV